MKKHSVAELLRFRTITFKRGNSVLDVKFEENSDNGWATPNNDWVNALLDRHFPVTYYDLINNGWIRV